MAAAKPVKSLVPIAVVLALLAGLPAAVWLDLRNISDTLLKRQAADIDSLLTSIRMYYADNVVGRVMKAPGHTAVVHNYQQVDGAIPIPATLSIELARTVSEQQRNITYRFVSDFSFAGRPPHPLDDFERSALEALRRDPGAFMSQTSWDPFAGRVRLISPVRMAQACVTCHNSHPDSPKKDWRVGDVRGIQEVSISQPLVTNILSFKYLLTYFALMTATGVVFIRLQKRQAREVAAANRELAAANAAMQRDLAAAAQVQEAMLPSALPKTPHASFAWFFKPSTHVAGDGVNVFDLDEHRVGMYVFDVVGHGPAAAMLAVAVARVLTPGPNSFLIRPDGSGGTRVLPPAEVATRLAERFPFESGAEQFFTLLYAVLDTRTGDLRYVSAGHLWPICVPRNGEPRVVAGEGALPIGLDDESYAEHSIALAPGDRLYVYSDGVPEAMNGQGELFGMARTLESLGASRGASLAESVSRLWDTIERWSAGAAREDDATLVAVELGQLARNKEGETKMPDTATVGDRP